MSMKIRKTKLIDYHFTQKYDFVLDEHVTHFGKLKYK